MGSLDSRGVYVYDVDDNVAPMHTLLNLGMSSVSSAISDAKQEAIDAMTPKKYGWRTTGFFTSASGWRNGGLGTSTRIRKVGDRVMISLVMLRHSRAKVNVGTTGGILNQTLAVLKPAWRPPISSPLTCWGGRGALVNIYPSGNVSISSVFGSRSIQKGEYVRPTGVYFLDW